MTYPVFTDLPVNEYYLSRAKEFPETKQLWIRNTKGGLIWQVYNVKSWLEVDLLTHTAKANGFRDWEVIGNNITPHEETWPDWRDNEMWQARINRFKEQS